VPFEPDSWLTTFYHSAGSRNYSKYSDPRLDQLIEKQRAIFDVPQRKAAVKDALSFIVENAPSAGWGGRYQGNAARTRVKDWSPEANSAIWGFQYEHIWLDV
jgi:peptide/nickel transport system substrate-binding protein